jgi:hypothetical protein
MDYEAPPRCPRGIIVQYWTIKSASIRGGFLAIWGGFGLMRPFPISRFAFSRTQKDSILFYLNQIHD